VSYSEVAALEFDRDKARTLFNYENIKRLKKNKEIKREKKVRER
jgi:hypothetical protein